MRRTQLKLGFALLLAAPLAACGGPRDQQGSSTSLDGDQNTQIAGVIVSPEQVGINAAQVAAAKARLPHQYDRPEPLNLFDFNTNLNPESNR